MLCVLHASFGIFSDSVCKKWGKKTSRRRKLWYSLPRKNAVVTENTLVLLVWGEYRLPTTSRWGFMELRGRAWSWPARETPSLPGLHLTKAKASSKAFSGSWSRVWSFLCFSEVSRISSGSFSKHYPKIQAEDSFFSPSPNTFVEKTHWWLGFLNVYISAPGERSVFLLISSQRMLPKYYLFDQVSLMEDSSSK